MPRTPLVVAAIAVIVVVAVAVIIYWMSRRDPPGSYDARPMHPGFRSKRGRGR